MKKIDTLINLFFPKFEEIRCSEELRSLERTVVHTTLEIPERDTLLEQLMSFPRRERIVITVYTGTRDPVSLTWNAGTEPDLPTKRRAASIFLKKIKNLLTPIEDEDGEDDGAVEVEQMEVELDEKETRFRIDISIDKINWKEKERNISIYSFKQVMDFLNQLTLSGLYFTFDEIFEYSGYIAFVLQEKVVTTAPFYTPTFYFIPEDYDKPFNYIDISKQERDRLYDKRNKAANFLSASQYRFIPQDFLLLQKSNDESINLLMDKLLMICSLTYICNLSWLEEQNGINCQLTGYRTIEQYLDIKGLEPHAGRIYFDIYEWIYTEGNVIDKIGLARNITSQKIPNDDFSRLDPGTFDSIKSSHLIYLKEQIEKYVEIIDKISQSIFDMCQKTSEMVDSFIGTFTKNTTAFVSYFISLIISNTIAGGKFKDIFTVEITAISSIILLVSLLFLRASIRDIGVKKKRFTKQYYRLKKRYKDILDEDDLENLFKRSIDIDEEKKHIDRQIKKYRNLWLVANIGFLLVIFYFGVYLKAV